MLRSLFSLLSPKGAQARLSILIFHRVLSEPDPLLPGEPDAASFDRLCAWVAEWFQVLSLDDAVACLKRGDLPARAMVITFDDGYADNHEVAMPILQRHGLVATFYVATGFLDGGRMWNDTVIESVRACQLPALDVAHLGINGLAKLPLGDDAQRRAAIRALLGSLKYRPVDERLQLVHQVVEAVAAPLPGGVMMRSDQVKALRQAGMTVGAHTVSHPILLKLTAEQARREIDQSRQHLEAILGEPVRHFAYPNGVPGRDLSDATAKLVRDMGFDSAVTTAWGAARMGADSLQLPRFTPWDRSRWKFGARLARNLWAT